MLSLTNLTNRRAPKISWEKIKEKILGKKYDLSLVFAPNALMKKLNSRYRKKNQPASVLSFSLSKEQGEIFINLSQKKNPPLYLFIHGLLHLKSFKHGAKMEIMEKKLMKKFNRYEREYYNRP